MYLIFNEFNIIPYDFVSFKNILNFRYSILHEVGRILNYSSANMSNMIRLSIYRT